MNNKLIIGLLILHSFISDTNPNTRTNFNTHVVIQEDSYDLHEANVVAVSFIEQNEESYEFDVTLYHDDDGEDGYADWWQVETLDGDILGRRVLTHAHGTQPFTRSQIITIPEGVGYVVVRGHDQIHDYGGQVIITNLETGEEELIQQGTAPLDFSDYLTSKPDEFLSSELPELTYLSAIVGIFAIIAILFNSQRKS